MTSLGDPRRNIALFRLNAIYFYVLFTIYKILAKPMQ